uniref:Lon protease homolog n=1 Tax=Rhabditophanes sp. KR3021 TaxID=114890 RepID=A0AC35TI46_9BILA
MKDMKFKRSNKGNGSSGKKAGGSQRDVAKTPSSGRKDVNASDRKSASAYLKPAKSDSGTAPSHSNEKKGVIGKWWNVLEIPCSPKKLYTKKKMRIPVRSATNLQTIETTLLKHTTPEEINEGNAKIIIAYNYQKGANKTVYEYGTLALIERIITWSTPNSKLQYSFHVKGLSRVFIDTFILPETDVQIVEDHFPAEFDDGLKNKLLLNVGKVALYFEGNTSTVKDLQEAISGEPKYGQIADIMVYLLNITPYPKQLEYLSTTNVRKRVQMGNEVIESVLKSIEQNKSRKPNEFSTSMESLKKLVSTVVTPPNLKNIMTKHKKNESNKNEFDSLKEKIVKLNLKAETLETVLSELERFKYMNETSSEYSLQRGYIQFICDLPWNHFTVDCTDLKKARSILNNSHEGMVDVKKRIMEFLAVKKLKNESNGPIICLVGPPGVGKTSVAKAIAQTLDRKFERISLGGIRDQSDIRGHKKTYIGSMPGRILQAIKQSKSSNAVILLDEIDKISAGVQGDPSAALLEVLDPEQNCNFQDSYLNLPFDLSKTLFIATANDLSTIPGPLLDRMEVVEMASYTVEEKIKIATNYIIPKQMKAHGLFEDLILLDEPSIYFIITKYTREAGVRQLERTISAILRNSALKIAENLNGGEVETDILTNSLQIPIVLNQVGIKAILGNEKIKESHIKQQQAKMSPGVAFGLAWTPVGGEVLVIEAIMCTGSGKLHLTGKLGDVIKESIQVAYSYIKGHIKSFKIIFTNLADFDIHLHIPSGSIEKDGPSAGCAFVCALLSLLTNNCVRNDTAMSGEITLSGHVLPVGGIKEKILAAHREGLTRIILPKANAEDIDKIDASILSNLNIIFVDDVSSMINETFQQTLSTPNYSLSKL